MKDKYPDKRTKEEIAEGARRYSNLPSSHTVIEVSTSEEFKTVADYFHVRFPRPGGLTAKKFFNHGWEKDTESICFKPYPNEPTYSDRHYFEKNGWTILPYNVFNSKYRTEIDTKDTTTMENKSRLETLASEHPDGTYHRRLKIFPKDTVIEVSSYRQFGIVTRYFGIEWSNDIQATYNAMVRLHSRECSAINPFSGSYGSMDTYKRWGAKVITFDNFHSQYIDDSNNKFKIGDIVTTDNSDYSSCGKLALIDRFSGIRDSKIHFNDRSGYWAVKDTRHPTEEELRMRPCKDDITKDVVVEKLEEIDFQGSQKVQLKFRVGDIVITENTRYTSCCMLATVNHLSKDGNKIYIDDGDRSFWYVRDVRHATTSELRTLPARDVTTESGVASQLKTKDKISQFGMRYGTDGTITGRVSGLDNSGSMSEVSMPVLKRKRKNKLISISPIKTINK